jgi:hypothetical protein
MTRAGHQRRYVTLAITASCSEVGCSWSLARIATRQQPLDTKPVTDAMNAINSHSKRHEHDVTVTTTRVFPGKRK